MSFHLLKANIAAVPSLSQNLPGFNSATWIRVSQNSGSGGLAGPVRGNNQDSKSGEREVEEQVVIDLSMAPGGWSGLGDLSE